MMDVQNEIISRLSVRLSSKQLLYYQVYNYRTLLSLELYTWYYRYYY